MNHGWAFMAGLTDAIEAWSNHVAGLDPDAFIYRGADLRHAVERTLFFRLANDAGLQQSFEKSMAKDIQPVGPTGSWPDVIAAHFASGNSQASKRHPAVPALSWKKRAKNRLGNLSRLGKRPFSTARLQYGADILFLVIHPKFVNFLNPVAKAFGQGAAFLALPDPVVEGYLAEKSLPSVAIRRGYSQTGGVILRHFPELCDGFDRFGETFDALKPRIVVVPEGNAPAYELALRAGMPRGIATVCLQHGAPAYTNPGLRNWNYTDVLVWGQAFVEPFARYNPTQHFTVIGTPADIPASRTLAAATPLRSIGFFLQKGATVIPDEEWRALLQFIAWVAESFPEIAIIIRDHPTQPGLTASESAAFKGKPNVRFMPPPHHSLNEVLAASDVVVAAASTTLLEAVQSGAIPFIFGTAYPRDFPDIAASGAAIAAADEPTAKTSLSRLMASGELRAELRRAGESLRPSLFAASGPEGAARIADALRAAASARRA